MHLTMQGPHQRKRTFLCRDNEGITLMAFANRSQLVLVQIKGQVVALLHLCLGVFYDNHTQFSIQP